MIPHRSWAWVITVVALAAMLSVAATPAQDRPLMVPHIPPSLDKVVIKVHDSTFNALAHKIGPLRLTGHYTFSVGACLPGTSLCGQTDICSSDWTVTVTQVHFAITPAGIRVTGTIEATWCRVNGTFALETSADARHVVILSHILSPPVFQRHDAIMVTVKPTSIQPVLKYSQYTVPLPVHFDVAPALSLPPIPLTTALLSFETAAGPQQLRLTPGQVLLAKRNGYLELQSSVNLW